MKIRIPHTIAHAWDIVVDWGDVDVIGPVRRIDVLLAGGGIFCVGWYWCFTAGWARCRAGRCICW